MANTIRRSAPGKVVLCGEYAVLDGAPAICLAVERRARVSLRNIGGETFEVTAPGFRDRPGHFSVTEAGVKWLAGTEPLPIVDAAWRAGLIGSETALAIDLDTAEFSDPDSGRKIGLGSSAALAVALSAALRNKNEVAACAINLHAELQGGSGSGVDIACSLNGGLIEFRMNAFSVNHLQWPAGLHYRLIWTGRPASTEQQLEKLERRESKASRRRLTDASENMAASWRGSNKGEIIDGYSEYIDCLHEFSVDHDLGIFDAGHYELWQAARESGLTYKPCGAGGGDIGIVLSTDDASLDAFADDLPESFIVLEAARSDRGLDS